MATLLAIDQGTTSSRAILFSDRLEPLATGQQEFPQHYPASGWVEHDPEQIWQSVLATCKTALQGGDIDRVAAIGITNQRETTLLWDRDSGKPLGNAIVWQDRRTAARCAELVAMGMEPEITERTGLLLDPYFSASKIVWLLEANEGARTQAEQGRLLFGTVDSFLIWRLTGGRVHATDATNAARTMLYNISEGCWDQELLKLFAIPPAILPEVRDCAADFGQVDARHFGRAIPISGVAGDQQAATVGQACFQPGMMKSTYGTGCFALMNTGAERVHSSQRLLTTIAYQLSGRPVYALEGSIFVAGAVVQWLRDGLSLIRQAADSQAMAIAADDAERVYLVPAFTGLGAPYWDGECRGAIYGLTRKSGPNELARAALESVAFQTRDLMEAMRRDWSGKAETVLRVDGGMAVSDWTMQAIANQLGAPVDRPKVTETTALGVAWLAGLQSGICPEPAEFARTWALDRRFRPEMPDAARDAAYAGWKDAVRRTLGKLP